MGIIIKEIKELVIELLDKLDKRDLLILNTIIINKDVTQIYFEELANKYDLVLFKTPSKEDNCNTND